MRRHSSGEVCQYAGMIGRDVESLGWIVRQVEEQGRVVLLRLVRSVGGLSDVVRLEESLADGVELRTAVIEERLALGWLERSFENDRSSERSLSYSAQCWAAAFGCLVRSTVRAGQAGFSWRAPCRRSGLSQGTTAWCRCCCCRRRPTGS